MIIVVGGISLCYKLNPVSAHNQRAILTDKIKECWHARKDGGDVILVDVTDEGVVKVQLTGACKGCPMSQMTLKDGIEKFVKSEIPEVVSVESV